MNVMQSPFARVFLFMLSGPIIWAGHFLFIYVVNGVACARPPLRSAWLGVPLSSWMIVAASSAALVAMALVYLSQRERLPHTESPVFILRLAGMLSLLSAMAVGWQTVPVLLVTPCG